MHGSSKCFPRGALIAGNNRSLVWRLLCVASVVLVMTLPSRSAAQSCESSAAPSCGGTCPLGSTCSVGGDPVEPGGIYCYCAQSDPACSCSIEAAAGDMDRLLVHVRAGERAAFHPDAITRGADLKTLTKSGLNFRKVGLTVHKATGILMQAGSSPRAEALEIKASRLYTKAKKLTDKIETQIQDAEESTPGRLDATTAIELRTWNGLVVMDLTAALSCDPCAPPSASGSYTCAGSRAPTCGGTCPSTSHCSECAHANCGALPMAICMCR